MSLWILYPLALLLALLTGPAIGQAGSGAIVEAPAEQRRGMWVVTPSVSVAETYTDNVFLSPKGVQASDWVTQVIPGILVTSEGPRLRFDLSYTPEITYYAHTEREENVFHRGRVFGNLELAEELLFLEGGAKIDQYDISLRSPLTTSNVSITGNRTTAATAYVSPYLLRDIGATARVEARFNYSVWKSDDEQGTLPDNDARRLLLRLMSGPAQKLLTWDIAYTGECGIL